MIKWGAEIYISSAFKPILELLKVGEIKFQQSFLYMNMAFYLYVYFIYSHHSPHSQNPTYQSLVTCVRSAYLCEAFLWKNKIYKVSLVLNQIFENYRI